MSNRNKYKKQKGIPVIFGAGVNAYGLVRSFSLIGVKSVVIDRKKNIASHSRFTTFCRVENPVRLEGIIKSLIALSSKYNDKYLLLIPTDDFYLELLSRNKIQLEKYSKVCCSAWSDLEPLLEKKFQYEKAISYGVRCPKTIVVNTFDEIQSLTKEFHFPIIVKPSNPIGFKNEIGLKVLKICDINDYFDFKLRIEKSSFSKSTFIVQELITGNVDALYTISLYADTKHTIRGYSTGHKLIQYPYETGTIVSGRTAIDDSLYELSIPLVKAFKLEGIVNIEFKKDPIDSIYKLIEINARPGLWNFSSTLSGVNLARLLYEDSCLNSAFKLLKPTREIIWRNTVSELLLKIFAFEKGQSYSFGKKENKYDAVCSLSDFYVYINHLLRVFRIIQ